MGDLISKFSGFIRCSVLYIRAGVLQNVLSNNTSDNTVNCVKTIITYLENIIKVSWLVFHCVYNRVCFQDLTNKKTQSIKLTNAFLNRNVLNVRGGLALLCFGPGCFSLSQDLFTVESCIADELAKIPAHLRGERARVWKEWLLKYVQFLKSV